MGKTFITIIMPLKYFYMDFLHKAIKSVAGQTSPLWNLSIVVEKNDLAKFNSILKEYLADNRIRILVNTGRKLAGAINTGIKSSKTEFCAILLADDLWSGDAVEILNRYITDNPSIDFFHSSRMIIDENGKRISPVYQSIGKFEVTDFIESSPVKHLLCWRKGKALEVGGLDESLNSVGPDDYDFPWTMAENGAKFKAVKECLYIYRDHRNCDRLTTDLPLSVHKNEIKRIFKKHGVDSKTIMKKLEDAEKTYLRQCIYKSSLQKFLVKFFNFRKPDIYREQY